MATQKQKTQETHISSDNTSNNVAPPKIAPIETQNAAAQIQKNRPHIAN